MAVYCMDTEAQEGNEMKVTLTEVVRLFPKGKEQERSVCAVSGLIPMEVFNAIEKDIRPEMRKRHLRVIYRGPRPDPKQSMTHRCDAKYAVIYPSYG